MQEQVYDLLGGAFNLGAVNSGKPSSSFAPTHVNARALGSGLKVGCGHGSNDVQVCYSGLTSVMFPSLSNHYVQMDNNRLDQDQDLEGLSGFVGGWRTGC